jgi:hypothetical protein
MSNNIHYSIIFFNSKLRYDNMKILEYYWLDGGLNNGEIVNINNNLDLIMKDSAKYLFMYFIES